MVANPWVSHTLVCLHSLSLLTRSYTISTSFSNSPLCKCKGSKGKRKRIRVGAGTKGSSGGGGVLSGDDPSLSHQDSASKTPWTPRYLSDLKSSNIYNRNAIEAPAEVCFGDQEEYCYKNAHISFMFIFLFGFGLISCFGRILYRLWNFQTLNH